MTDARSEANKTEASKTEANKTGKTRSRKAKPDKGNGLKMESLNPAVRSVVAQTRAAAYEALLQEPIRPPRGAEPFATTPLYSLDTVIPVVDRLAQEAFRSSVREIESALIQCIVHGRKALDIEDVKMVVSRLNLSPSALERALKSSGVAHPIVILPETFYPVRHDHIGTVPPGTAAPGTAAPGTAAPGTAVPGTAVPGT